MKTNRWKLILSVTSLLLSGLTFASASPLTLVATNAIWKYRSDGIDLGAAWTGTAYHDSSWLAGPAQLGFGDGDEATVLNFGPDPATRPVTAYFRKSIMVPGGVSDVTMRLLRDDGAVVYINGVEVFRNNMPAGPVLYNTLATIAIGGADETTYLEAPIPAAAFFPGTNVIAVEIHQVNVTSSDLSFALELLANVSPPGPQVSVATIDAEAAEISPLLDIPENPASFRISRTGSTNNPLSLGIRLSGTASNGVDYDFVSNIVTIPAGSLSTDVFIHAIDDNLAEGTESVILTLVPSPCMECYGITSNSTATVYILDNEPAPTNTPPTVSILSPVDGATFTLPTNILLRASANDAENGNDITVEFFLGTARIGTASFVAGVCPTCPYYSLIWSNPPLGTLPIFAIATDKAGAHTVSAPVHITVSPPTNQPATVTIVSPTNGAVFTSPAPIFLLAGVHDPDGIARNATLQIFANNVSLGYAQITDPGPEHDQAFRFTWTNALAGSYVLTAQVRDEAGASSSTSIQISVQNPQPPTSHELHAVGVYSGNFNGGSSPHHEQGHAWVSVDRPGKGVTLFLSAYEPVLWHVAATNGTVIERVILGGYYRQDIDGLPAGVPVVTRYYDNGAGSSDYLYVGYTIDSVQFLRTVPKLCDLTGLDLSSFQGTYTAPAPAPFVIASVQSDPRLRCNYPQPVDPAGLPSIAFDLAFLNLGSADGLYTRHYTLAGPQNGGRLLPGMNMVPDQSGQRYYGTESQYVYKYDSEDGVSLMDLGSGVPELSWPTGVAFDSARNRTLLVSLGGEGYLYGFAAADQQWSLISSMNNRDANGIAYHAADDSIYAVATTYDETQARLIWRLNASGQLTGQIPLPQMPFNFGSSGYQTILVSAGDYLVLLLEPTYRYFYGTSPMESRIYLIDPRTSQVWLTYRKALLRDSDDDGVPDDQDQCPNTPRGELVDAHGCGASQQDSDHDGVPNSLDQCPNTPAGVTVDAHGCPRFNTCEPGIYWQVELGSDGNEQALKVHQTPDGGYIVGGTEYHSGKMWLVRLSASGAKVWEKLLGSNSADYLKDLQPVSTGGYIIAGAEYAPSPNDYQAELVRLDDAGNVLWARTYGGTGIDVFDAVHETSDGGFIAVGNSDSPAGAGKISPNFGNRDAWVVKVDASGNKQWDRSYGGQLVEFGTAVLQAPDGSYLVSVASESPAGGNKALAGFGASDGWLLKLNPAGDKIWERAYGTTNHDWLLVVDILPNGSALLTGTAGAPASGNKTSLGFGQSDAWVLLVDSLGNTVWERTFGGSDFDTLLAADRMPDGGYILAGYSESPPSGNKTSPKVAGNDFWLVRIDANGSKLWERSIGGGGPYGSLANAVKHTADGGFIVVGETFNDIGGDKTVPWYGSDDGWLVKLSPENNDCDGDGIPNNLDQCPNTPMGEPVDAHGCGISQLCPCEQPWRNHNEYVRCVRTNAEVFLSAGFITSAQEDQIVQAARDSTCGRRNPRLIMPPQPVEDIRNTGCHLILDGDGPVTCVIECSEDLKLWRPISTNLLDGVEITILDTETPRAPRRFYRIQPTAP